ncbi:MAG TPA: hypothetical protein VJT16_17770, partial [Streptosporangiaceae bacterium]|nr:hypothetical protein [Streptosporangiaceae bacterium]
IGERGKRHCLRAIRPNSGQSRCRTRDGAGAGVARTSLLVRPAIPRMAYAKFVPAVPSQHSRALSAARQHGEQSGGRRNRLSFHWCLR